MKYVWETFVFSLQLYMYQLFRSLAYIHSLGICHRDIKPQNLLLDPDTGVLKLCDFGSAKHLVKGEPNVSYICSRYYRAPELIFGAIDYTTKIGKPEILTPIIKILKKDRAHMISCVSFCLLTKFSILFFFDRCMECRVCPSGIAAWPTDISRRQRRRPACRNY